MGQIQIIEKDLQKLTEYIKSNHNYDFSNYALFSFRRRIERIMEIYQLPSIDVLIAKFSINPLLFEKFISEITVNVTEMFRDPSFWVVLKEKVVPNILLNKDEVNIWHAGCSSGEEIFSIAILLDEAGIIEKTHILATDIDSAIIQKAQQAKIKIKNMEINIKNYELFKGKYELARYFDYGDQYATLKKHLLEKITFIKHDLVQQELFEQFDLVSCRNVMIYFNQELQNRVLYKLHKSLYKFGYLCIGSKESLIWSDIAKNFFTFDKEEKIYEKIED